MQIDLTLSKNSAYSTSAWTGTAQEHVEYVNGLQHVYNTYTYTSADVTSGDEVTVTVPAALSDVTFSAAAFTYDTGQTQSGGTRTLRFKDTGKNVTDASILARLRAGDTAFTIQFYYRAAGGTGGSGTHYATCSWKHLKISVTYTPNSKISGYAEASDGTSVYYGLDADNLARGESMPVRVSFTAKKAVAGVTFSVTGDRGGGGSAALDMTASPGGAWDNVFTFTLPADDPSLWTDRVGHSADICIVINYADGQGAASTGQTATALKLVKERLAPALSLSFTDTAGVYAAYGVYVQNRSVLSAAPSVTPDTGADPDNAAAFMTLTLGSQTYSEGGGAFDIGAPAFSGSLGWTLTVTDSYGVTGTLTGTLMVTPWSPPCLTDIEPERYSSGVDTGGNPVYLPDDGGTDIRVSLSGSVSPVNGLNAWTLTMSATDGNSTFTRTLMTGADGQSITLNEDRSVFDALLSASHDWAVTLTLTDAFASAVYDGIVIPRAGAILNIEKTGVAVGMRSTGTQAEPLFQVAYPAQLARVERLDGREYDTGWVDLTYLAATGAFTPTANCFMARRIDCFVHLRVAGSIKNSLASNTWLTVSEPLPGQFRPERNTECVLPASTPDPGWLRVNADGRLQIYRRGSQANAGWWVSGGTVYSVERPSPGA